MRKIAPRDATLLVIDVQEKLVPTLWRRERFLKRVGLAIRAARALEMPVLATEQYPEGLGKTVPEIASLLDGGDVVAKTCFSSLRSPDGEKRLRSSGRRQLVIVGAEAHICVLQTVLDALDTGLGTFVAMDAVTSSREEDCRWAQERMVQAGAVPTTVQGFVYELLGEAPGPKFKEMLPLLKEIAAPDPG